MSSSVLCAQWLTLGFLRSRGSSSLISEKMKLVMITKLMLLDVFLKTSIDSAHILCSKSHHQRCFTCRKVSHQKHYMQVLENSKDCLLKMMISMDSSSTGSNTGGGGDTNTNSSTGGGGSILPDPSSFGPSALDSSVSSLQLPKLTYLFVPVMLLFWFKQCI